jgi:hypothetical protein
MKPFVGVLAMAQQMDTGAAGGISLSALIRGTANGSDSATVPFRVSQRSIMPAFGKASLTKAYESSASRIVLSTGMPCDLQLSGARPVHENLLSRPA